MELNNTTNDIAIKSTDQAFSINRWFNEHPVRVVGTLLTPFFYAQDLGNVLGIKHVKTSLDSFIEGEEIVTPVMRVEHNIVTYRKRKNGLQRDNSIILLTDLGAYHLILNSRSEKAKEFRRFIYGLVREAQQADREKLNMDYQFQLTKLSNEKAKIAAELQDYKSHVKVIYAFKRELGDVIDPYTLIPPQEINTYFLEQRDSDEDTNKDGSIEYLYKLTKQPTSDDYSNFTLYAKIYDTQDNAFSVFDGDIPITDTAFKYCRYLLEEPDFNDVSDIKVVDM